jgi:hypothetical protein
MKSKSQERKLPRIERNVPLPQTQRAMSDRICSCTISDFTFLHKIRRWDWVFFSKLPHNTSSVNKTNKKGFDMATSGNPGCLLNSQ